jgi:predicted transcriptional regulator
LQLTEKQLEKLRVQKGKQNLSIGTLAKAIGISRYTMGTIINGKTMGLSTNTKEKLETWLSEQE